MSSASAIGAARDSTSKGSREATSAAAGQESVIQKYLKHPGLAPSVNMTEEAHAQVQMEMADVKTMFSQTRQGMLELCEPKP
jgi:hypothetical protein